MHGKGKLTSGDKSLTIEGTWHRGLLHGTATQTFKSGKIIEGHFQNGELTHGKLTLPNSKVTYEGEFMNGEAHGKGELTDPDNDMSYRGEFY